MYTFFPPKKLRHGLLLLFSPTLPILKQALICFLSLQIVFPKVLYQWNHQVCTLFYQASFIQHDYSEIHSCCVYQHFIPVMVE